MSVSQRAGSNIILRRQGAFRARGLKRENGSTLIEYAFVFVVFVAIVWGIIDFSRALYAYHFVGHAAKSAARWAAVNGGMPPGSTTPTCNSDAGGSDPGSCTAPVTCTTANTPSTCSLCTTNCTNATQKDIGNYVTMITPVGIDPSRISTSATWPTPTAPEPTVCTTQPNVSGCDCYTMPSSNPKPAGCVVEVTVSYQFSFLFPSILDLTHFGAAPAPITLSSTSEVVIDH